MENFIFIITILLLLFIKRNYSEGDSVTFSYDPDNSDGPTEWRNVYKDCGKKRQSPINIQVSTLNRGLFPTQLQLRGLNSTIKSVEIENDGSTVEYTFAWNSDMPYLSGGPLSGTYVLDSFHFHWSVVDSDGSEHAINGRKYAMECHFVFYNKAYSSSKKALNYSNGFAVIGILFEMNRLAPDMEILKMVNTVPKGRKSITIAAPVMNLRELLPNNFAFAYYQGSLTTPPCYQIVDWIVSMEIQTVNHMQLKALRQLRDESSRPIAPNNRPLQMDNRRTVLLGLIDNE